MLLAEGDDFEPVFQNITFRPQESTTQEVQLKIVSDDTAEGPENLMLVVMAIGGQQEVPINVTIIEGTFFNAQNAVEVSCPVKDMAWAC